MKQTLSDIAAILCEIDKGKQWEFLTYQGNWVTPSPKFSPFYYLQNAHAIRIKPAEPDAEGWIPWSGGECPVPLHSTVEYRLRAMPVTKRCVTARDLCWTWWGNGSDVIAYRLAPKPEYIPLGPEDVPPGSVFRIANGSKDGWHQMHMCPQTEAICFSSGISATYRELFDFWQINKSLPFTGKWDPTAWEPCRKQKPQTN